MRRKSVFKSVGLAPKEFTNSFISKVRGMTALEYTSYVKTYSTDDFRIILDTLDVEYKTHEGRILLLMKVFNRVTKECQEHIN